MMNREALETSRPNRLLCVWILVVFALIATLSQGQSVQTGTLLGTVMDSSGAMVPDVTITVTNDTGLVVRTVKSSGDGSYMLQSLPPGSYELAAEGQGFGKVQKANIPLRAGDNLRIDVTLMPPSVTQSVQVIGTKAPLVDTVDANRDQTFDSSEFRDVLLPANDVTSLVSYLPGAVNSSIQNGRAYTQIQVLVDGATDGDEYQDGGNWQFNPPPEDVSEFRVTQNNYTAELGGTSGIREEMITKSGTTRFHGSVFSYLRNEAFNAKPWGSPTKAETRYFYNGYTIGGPIKKERIYFFFSNYFRRENEPSSSFRTWPTQAEASGDFSAWLNPPNGLAPRIITNPVTQQPFQGNIIPQSMLNANAVAYLKTFYPLVSDPQALVNNGYTSGSKHNNDDYYNARFDFRASDKLNMYVRLGYDNRLQTSRPASAPPRLPHPDASNYLGIMYSGTVAGTYLFSPKVLL